MKFSKIGAMFLTFIAMNAYAGGSSTVGVGSPKFSYRCADSAANIFVDIVSLPPEYKDTSISVQTMVPMSVHVDDKARIVLDKSPGSARTYQGSRFTVSVSETTLTATLTDAKSWEPKRALSLTCETFLNN